MSKYVLTYHMPTGYVPNRDAQSIDAWQSFFRGIGDHLVELGQPVIDRRTLGEAGSAMQLQGYSIIDASDFESAIALANDCPTLSLGGGVQVGELGEVPAAARTA